MGTPTKTTTARGLGHDHRKRREYLLKLHVDGSPCWWCGRPMWRDKTKNFDHNPASRNPGNGALAADHTLARAHGGRQADRLLHGLCNNQRKTGRNDDQRPALTATRDGLGTRALPWPR